jgi:hypothetical protein
MTEKRKPILVSDLSYLLNILTMIGQHNSTSESIKRIDVLYRSRLMPESTSTSSPSFPRDDDHARASARPRSTSTPAITGSAAQSMNTRKTNAYRMLPVKSATRPTMRGPIKDEDCCKPPNQCTAHSNLWRQNTHTLSVMENRPYHRASSPGGMISAYKARA